jgi:hypothetical protein
MFSGQFNMKLIFTYWSAVYYSAAFPPPTYKEMIIVAFFECAKTIFMSNVRYRDS